MDNKTIEFAPPTYERLGKRAFFLILSKYLNTGLLCICISLGIALLTSTSMVKESGVAQSGVLGFVGIGLLLFGIVSVLIGVGISWISYKSQTYAVTEDAFKIRRGIFQKIEIAIPYRQIQDISLKRSLFQQILGVSRIEVLTAGEDNDPSDDAVLPVIDTDKAEKLQSELVRRANVQKTINQS